MRGSRIAKQIITEQRKEAKRKYIALELRKAMLRRRGESNHDNSNTIDNINNN